MAIISLLDFGKHAPFIWGAYGTSFIVLFGLVLLAIARNRD